MRWYVTADWETTPDKIKTAIQQSTIQSTQKNYLTEELSEPLVIYKKEGQYWYWPTFVGMRNFGVKEYRVKGVPLREQVKFIGKLQESRFQPQAVEAVVAQLEKSGGAILQKACGMGKTVDAIAIAARMGVKFGVMVDKTGLLTQWKERIEQYMPECRVGIAQGKHVDLDCDCILVMGKTQSIYRYDFPDVGLWIFDECHKFCAATLSTCLPIVASRYMLALSATPHRKDGMHEILYAWFDSIAFSKQRDKEDVEVYRIKCKEGTERYMNTRMGKKLNTAAMVNAVCDDKERTELIAKHLVVQLDDDRRILLLSDRIEHLKMIEKEVNHQLRCQAELEDVLSRLENLTKPLPYSIDYYIGGRKSHELQEAQKANLILATFQMAKEYLDLQPPCDTLILASPKSDIEQAVGRIRLDGLTVRARILDFVDPFSIFYAYANARYRFYSARKYELVFFDGMKSESCVPGPQGEPQEEMTMDFPD